MTKSRIFIVEDEVIVARDISQQLVELGYEPVGTCTRGEEAVDQVEQLRPDLVLMDIQLAGAMDGIAAATIIRERFALPVVFLTAFAESETLNRAKLSEPFGYIIKPFDERELRTVIDIALFKHQADNRLRESEERYRLLFDENPLPMWVYEEGSQKIVAANAASLRQYGHTRAEMLGLSLRDLMLPEDDPVFLQGLKLEDVSPEKQREVHHRRRDGTVFPAEIFVRPMTFSGQSAWLVIATDITEKKQLQEQFLRAQRLESLGTLASGIAHDLNNMLAPILFAGPLLRTSLTSPRDLRIIDTVEKSAERGSSLVRQILGFAQGATSALRITQLKHIVRDVLSIVEVSFPKQIRLEQHIATNAWPILANPTQMHQVLLNLCVNARDAMPRGGTLGVSLHNRHLEPEGAAAIPGARAGDWLIIEVKDDGTGIPKDVLPLIWDSFYTTKPEGKGTGLGLPTVRNIVREHGGFIQVETAVGHGSTFRVFLPANREDKARPDSESPFPQAPGREEFILVVDDDVSVREIVSAVLNQGGYRVLECADGVEAIVNYNARSRDIALVITDVDMPNLGGAILAATLLRLNPGLRIIAMSGHTSSAVNRDQVDEIKGMATAFLQKPFTATALLAAVHRVLHADPQP